VFERILSLSIVSFWDGTKVCGEKKPNKTARAYSGLRNEHMRERGFSAARNAGAAQTGCEPLAVVSASQPNGGTSQSHMCENRCGVFESAHSAVSMPLAARRG